MRDSFHIAEEAEVSVSVVSRATYFPGTSSNAVGISRTCGDLRTRTVRIEDAARNRTQIHEERDNSFFKWKSAITDDFYAESGRSKHSWSSVEMTAR